MFWNAFCATMGVIFGLFVFSILFILAVAAIIVHTEDDKDGD